MTRWRSERARELLDGGRAVAPRRMEALDGADAAVLVTEWPEFAELDWAEAAERMARPLLVDGRNFLDAAKRCAPRASSTRESGEPAESSLSPATAD